MKTAKEQGKAIKTVRQTAKEQGKTIKAVRRARSDEYAKKLQASKFWEGIGMLKRMARYRPC